MTNPFEKLFGESQGERAGESSEFTPESGMEVEKVARIGEEIEDDAAYVWKVFEDGSEDVNNKRRLVANPNDPTAVRNEIREIAREWGAEEAK